MRTIVVSAVNLRKGGTLAILRSCLEYLSQYASEYRVVALVHKKELCDYPGIEYIELPWCIRSWAHRLWAEYVTMHRISGELAAEDGHKVWLWLSMHDTTPRVEAERREVYCHTSFPFLKVKFRDWLMDPKIPIFAIFAKWAYRINAACNDSIIVQQNWFADKLSELLDIPRERFRVIHPQLPSFEPVAVQTGDVFTFLYVSTPDCHKNFETLCAAAEMLEKDGLKFKLVLAIKGDENRYARWLYRRWGKVESIDFHGYLAKDKLVAAYCSADCFVFPSRIETWGLPISEYIACNPAGGLILADLPYAHETAYGRQARYFTADDVDALKKLMYESIADR